MTESASIAQANADIMAFNDGAGALLHAGKYLLERVERAENEFRRLDNLPWPLFPFTTYCDDTGRRLRKRCR